jgi:hypothetical protein
VNSYFVPKFMKGFFYKSSQLHVWYFLTASPCIFFKNIWICMDFVIWEHICFVEYLFLLNVFLKMHKFLHKVYSGHFSKYFYIIHNFLRENDIGMQLRRLNHFLEIY